MLACRPGTTHAADAALEVVVPNDAETLDPRYVVDAVGMRVTRLVHAGLTRLDPDTLEPRPYAAESYRYRDPLTLEVTLRRDVHFHSGAPLTARDVVATLAAFRDPKVASRHTHVFDALARVEAVDATHVVFHLARPHATLLSDLEVPILRADQAAGPPDPKGALDGLGPYVVKAVSTGEVDLEPADGSPLPRPHHGLRIRTVHDENARVMRVLGGRADVMVNGVSPAVLPALEREKGVEVKARPGANLTYLLFRTDQGVFAGADRRRAVELGIDRRAIVKYLLEGRARLATGLLPPGHWSYTPRPDLPARDVARARALLGGMHVHCTFLTSTERLRVSIARVVAQELEDVGFEVEVVPLELGTLLARLSSGDFDAAILQIPELTEPNVLRVFLHSTSIPPAGANRSRVRDPDVDALLDAGDATTDRDARRADYAKLEDRVLAQAYWIPLWHEDQIAVVSARASSFVPSAEGRWLGLASVP